jgi:hypothetical protein
MTNLNSSYPNLLRSLLDVVLKHTMMLIGLGSFYVEIEELAIAYYFYMHLCMYSKAVHKSRALNNLNFEIYLNP